MTTKLTAKICSRGLAIPAAAFMARLGGRPFLNKFLNALTVWEKPQRGKPKMYARARRCAYTREKKDGAELFHLPRIAAKKLEGAVVDAVEICAEFARSCSSTRKLPEQACVPKQPLYSYQQAAVDYICRPSGPFDAYHKEGAAYVVMGTGFGKTRFAAAVAAAVGGPAFFVVPTEAIRQQTLDEIAEVFPDLKCGAYKNTLRNPPTAATHDIVVGIVNTVRVKEPGFFDGYSLVVLDEAHEYHSPKNVQVLRLIQEVPRILGITATPDMQNSGLDKIVYHYLGKPIIAKTDIPGFDISDVNFRGVVREVAYHGNPEYCETKISKVGTISTIETIGNIIRDPVRMSLVACEVHRLYHLHETNDKEYLRKMGLGPRPEADATKKLPAGEVRRHGVFVFAEHREYLPALRDALLKKLDASEVYAPELETDAKQSDGTQKLKNTLPDSSPPDATPGAPPGITSQVLRGGATKADLDTARKSRVVLTTYGYSRRGVSIVDMTAIVLATPRRNGMTQILGRVTRRGSDESIIRVVVDIKDVRTALKSQNYTRRETYRAKKYPITYVKYTHEDVAQDTFTPEEAETLVWAPDLEERAPDDTKITVHDL